jgi:WRKY DNA -binding domain
VINPTVSSVSHPNDEITAQNFRFKSYGKKPLKKELLGHKCKYYRCTHKGCPAKYQTTMSPGGCRRPMYFSEPHNHDPPPKP